MEGGKAWGKAIKVKGERKEGGRGMNSTQRVCHVESVPSSVRSSLKAPITFLLYLSPCWIIYIFSHQKQHHSTSWQYAAWFCGSPQEAGCEVTLCSLSAKHRPQGSLHTLSVTVFIQGVQRKLMTSAYEAYDFSCSIIRRDALIQIMESVLARNPAHLIV